MVDTKKWHAEWHKPAVIDPRGSFETLEKAMSWVLEQQGFEKCRFEVNVYATGTIARPVGFPAGLGVFQVHGPTLLRVPDAVS